MKVFSTSILWSVLVLALFSSSAWAQIDARTPFGLSTMTTAEMNGITSPQTGSVIFNTDDGAIYRYDGSSWVTSTDDQTSTEVNLSSNLDADGDANVETTVQEVLEAISPITSKAARIFYPPSIAIDASTNGSFSVDLYQQYLDQFGSVVATSDPINLPTVPVYGRTELYYFVTYANPSVFNTANMSIDGNGNLSYEIIGQPVDYNTLINVVFVVK